MWNRIADFLDRRGYDLVLLAPEGSIHLSVPSLRIPIALKQFAKLDAPANETLTAGPSAEMRALVDSDRAWCWFDNDYQIADGLAGYRNCESFARSLIHTLKPSLALLWGSTPPQMRVVRSIFDANQVPTFVLERGLLPRTLMIESRGFGVDSELNTSFLARSLMSKENQDDALYERAKRYYSNASVQKYAQDAYVDPGELRRSWGTTHRVVTLFGQHDVAAGLDVATGAARRVSPEYDSTASILEDLVNWAASHRVALVFKPHPGDGFDYETSFAGRPVRVERRAHVHSLFAASDVVVAMLSTVQFELLFFDTPLVLLGRSQLWGKQIAYECSQPSELARCLGEALDRVDSQCRMRRARRFVASTLKHFLVATEPGVPASHDLEDLADFIADNASYVTPERRLTQAIEEFSSSWSRSRVLGAPAAAEPAGRAQGSMASTLHALQRAIAESHQA